MNKPLPASVQASHPLRQPDWRWQRALAAVRGDTQLSRRDDDCWTEEAVEHLRGRDCPSAEEHEVTEQQRDLDVARKIAHAADRKQLELETRLLAGESFQQIASSLVIRPGVVEAFEAVFFNVQDRLEAETYISLAILKMPWQKPVSEPTLAKACGYFGGSLLVDVWLDYLDHREEEHDLATPEGQRRACLERFRKSFVFPRKTRQRRTSRRRQGTPSKRPPVGDKTA